MFEGIWLMLLGVLAAPSLILAKKPNAKEMLDKITPYQGWIGAISALWGAWSIISAILNLGILGDWPIWWISWMGGGVLQFSLGMLLGIGTLKTFIKAPAAQEKMDQLVAKMAPKQGILGLIAICFGIWVLLASFLFNG